MTYINETDFVINNKELVYPEIVTDGLQLYYDAKGKRDTDYHRDTILDMSGNKNHGKLYNFAYEKHSGYKDGLVFDYVDDKLVRPALDLNPNDFTFMLNGNIISFSPDGTVKRVQDGKVIERKGINLVRNGNFFDGTNGWTPINGTLKSTSQSVILTYNNSGNTYCRINRGLPQDVVQGEKIYVRAKIKALTETQDLRVSVRANIGGEYGTSSIPNPEIGTEYTIEGIHEPEERHVEGMSVRIGMLPIENSSIEISEIQYVNLTATYGAGNEPTLEEIQAEPDKWQWLPSPLDLIEAEELKGNILGDMENIIDGLYKTEVLSGTEIYTDKADDDAIAHVEIDGKSYQHAGSGKNMFNKYLLSDRSKYTLGTYSASPVLQLKPNTAYILSASRVNPSPDGNQLVLIVMDATDGSPIFGSSDYEPKKIRAMFNMVASHSGFDNFRNTFITPESGLISFSYYDNKLGKSSEGNWFTDVMIDAQLEEGSVATEYEPPAPSPDYPIEIHSLNDFYVVSGVGGRNYVTKNSYYSGKTLYGGGVGSPGYLVDNNDRISYEVLVEPNTDYELTIYGDGYFHRLGEFSLSSNKSIVDYTRYNSSLKTMSLKTSSSTGRLIVTIHNNGKGFPIPFEDVLFKLEKVNIATDWTPAPEDIQESDNHPLIDKINLLLDEPLRSVGDVKDRLFRDSDGLWKVERNIYEYNFTGEEFIGKYNTEEYLSAGKIAYRTSKINYPEFLSLNGQINSHYKSGKSIGQLNASKETSVTLGSGSIFYLVTEINSNTDTVEKINTYVSSLNMVHHYVLKTPIIETLDNSLQDKLNNLRTFKDSNYIHTVLSDKSNHLSDNLKPTLHAKFLYNNWYKEDRVINNLMIYNRALTNEEMLQNYKMIKRRWRM